MEIQEQSSAERSWIRLLVSSLASILFGVFVYSQATQSAQENDHESFQTIQEAEALVKGCHHFGLIEYSHHPIGRAYLLIPFIGRLEKLEQVPLVVGVVAMTLALFACLMIPAPPFVTLPIVAMFAALPWQGGFIHWIGNIHQHSYNFSLFLLLIAFGITVRRAWLGIGILAFIAGWIGYDFVFIYAFTVFTVRFLYWTCRESNSWLRATWAAIGEASFFLAMFIFDMTLKFVQNTLYFSSAVMAQQDLFINILYRTNTGSNAELTLGRRFEKVTELLPAYVDRFLNDGRWAHKESLFAVALISIVILATQTFITKALDSKLRRWGLLTIAFLSSSMTIVGWLYLAPNHAEPHMNLFARLLLIPCVLFPMCVLLVFSRPRARSQVASMTTATVGILTFALSMCLFLFVPPVVSPAIDRMFYPTVWDGLTAGIRPDADLGTLLPATATTSSMSPDSELNGPLKSKGNIPMVYPTDMWGRLLDNEKSLRWMPDPKNPLPAWYQVTFIKPSNVSHVALRFWDLPKNCGKNTPEKFYLERIDQSGQVIDSVPLSSNSGQPTHQGKYLNLLLTLPATPAVSALRLVIEKTTGGDVPVLFDFHAFGTEAP